MLSLSQILEGVKILDAMLGIVNKLKYVDHDVAYMGKFPEFTQQVYMEIKGEGPSRDPILELKQWITGIYNTWIMNLLEIPHFGRGKDVNACVKQLLERVNGGILWMDRHVSTDMDLIVEIMGLPTDGAKPEQYLDEKTKEKAIENEIKIKYGTGRGSKGMITKQIIEPSTRFATKFMT
jgi:hypothetical protein